MKNKDSIQSYINRFRKALASKLQPDIGMEVIIHPIKEEGAIFEFVLGHNKPNSDHYVKVNNKVSQALGKIDHNFFERDLARMQFGGTNIIAKGDRIIIIKGDDDDKEWGESSAGNDVQRLMVAMGGVNK